MGGRREVLKQPSESPSASDTTAEGPPRIPEAFHKSPMPGDRPRRISGLSSMTDLCEQDGGLEHRFLAFAKSVYVSVSIQT